MANDTRDTKNPTRPSKYDQSVARARGESMTLTKDDVGTLSVNGPPTIDDIAASALGVVEHSNPSVLTDALASGDFEMATQLLTLKEGDMLRGVLESEGSVVFEDMDRKTGEVIKRDARTWTIRVASGIRVSILGAAALDRQLKDAIGRNVIICRGKETKTRQGMNLTEYLVVVGKSVAQPALASVPGGE